MRRLLLVSLLGMYSFEAAAQEPHQWLSSAYSMYDLVRQGYELKAYVDNTPRAPPTFGHFQVVYFLQKDRELARCVEYKINAGASTPLPRPYCSMLTKPN